MFSVWLLKTRLARVERKLRRFRARQRQIRVKYEEIEKEVRRGAASADQKTHAKKLHDEKEHLTHEIHVLQGDEERLKAELAAAGVAPGAR